MSFEWTSYFECVHCGTTERTSAVTYDTLGYPVCPGCGMGTRPAATRTGDN